MIVVALALVGLRAEAAPVEVCATTATLGSLAREVGGESASVTAFAKGTEDAHFVDPRPSFIKKLSQADLLVLNGMDLEIGWLPALLPAARNAAVLPGAPGYLDGSQVIAPLEVPVQFDRSMGDVHPYGNPHYLLDPVNGLAVAGLIRDRLSEIRPSEAAVFASRYADFERRVVEGLVGEKLAREHGVEKLSRLAGEGTLLSFLETSGDLPDLGGWLGLLRPRSGMMVAADHNLWAYFARRFELETVGYLEPKPGIPPTTAHLRVLIERMRARNVKLILSAAYYNPDHARFVAEQTGARVASMAHEVGAREGAEDYLRMVDYNVRQLLGDGGGS
jgi:ABC-type Zn uptake system ZnuABC Zn-binding protein ZnuA